VLSYSLRLFDRSRLFVATSGIVGASGVERWLSARGSACELDTGASHCLFARVYAEALGFGSRKWQRLTFATANSRFDAFGHELTIDVLGIEVTALVFSLRTQVSPKKRVGRQGWLDRIRLGLVDYDRKLYAAGYDEGS